MLTFYDRILRRAGGPIATLCAAAAICAGTATRVCAQPAPPNDNLTNAQTVSGVSGSVSASNVGATAQPGEPAPYPGNPAQASIWYIWTAPITTTIDFNTFGSSDPNTGLQLDTVMAAYSLTGTNLTFSNLTQLATNDDDPAGGLTSRIDFPVKLGNVYLIQVDGSTNTPNGSNAQGNINLSWAPSLVAGNFTFSAGTYSPGNMDDILPVDYGGNPMTPSLANASGTNNVRITVVRQGGNTGRCEVTFTMTNGFYTNEFITNRFGTNIFTTNFNVGGGVASFTNTYFTNIASENLIQDLIGSPNESGTALVQHPFFNDFTVSQTNLNGLLTPSITNSVPLTSLGLTNYFTNFPCVAGIVTNGPTTNGSIYTISITQIFCSGLTITNRVIPSASNGLDYTNLTTNLTFNDFQTSQDVYVAVNPKNSFLTFNDYFGTLGPDWPDANGNSNAIGINSMVIMSLTNAVLDPLEDQDITPPTIQSNSSSAVLNILNFNENPMNYIGSPQYINTNVNPGQFVVINLERGTFRINKSSSTAYLYVLMSGVPAVGATYTVHYTIDSAGVTQGSVGIPNNAFNWNRFTTVARSDYAQPNFFGVDVGADFGIPINAPTDPSGLGVGGNTAWPSGVSYVGSFTILAPPSAPVAEIAIPILNNGAVEFDMDMLVQIFVTSSDYSANLSQTVPGYLGNIVSAPLTINFSGAEPGGANDVSFNVDNSPQSEPLNNSEPGANGGAVQAIAMQTDGQAVIGGTFTSYNGPNVYGITRLQTNGFLDTTFNNVLDGGVDGFVRAIAIDASGRIVIGGSFSSYNGIAASNIARLNTDGSLDRTFNTAIGFNSTVYALAIDANSNILVGGDFTTYNATNVNYFARLLPSGGLDPTFIPNTANGNPNYGANGDVMTLGTDGNGNIVLGGFFNQVNGTNLSYLARLLTNGLTDRSFTPNIGPDGEIYSLAIETDNEIVIGGAFQNYQQISRNSIALINTDGSLDTNFLPGTGADGVVYSVILQNNEDILVGGQFRTFNGSRRLGIARLLPSGWVDTSYMDTSYDQYAGLINQFYNDPINTCYAQALQPDGNVVIGGSFVRVGGGSTRDDFHPRISVARVIGTPTVGPQTGGGGIGNYPGNITMLTTPYIADNNEGKCFVILDRVNGSLGPAQLTLGTNLLPAGPGAATSSNFSLILPDTCLYNEVYNHWITDPYGNYDWRMSDGYWGTNNSSLIDPTGLPDGGESALNLGIVDNKNAAQNLFATLTELNINSQGLLSLGGVPIPMYPAYGVPSQTLDIVNVNTSPGVLGFNATNYVAVNTSNSVILTVVRTNGNAGAVSVEYYTVNGTALSNINYTGESGTKTLLNFSGSANDTVATFSIPILNTGVLQSNRTFHVFLTDPSYANAFDTNVPPAVYSNTTVTIIDGNFAPGHLSFTSPTYSVLKGGLATIGIQRTGGASGVLEVQCGTSDGTASNGLNYTGVTTNFTWNDQDVSVKTMTIQTLQDNVVEGPKTVNVTLFNPTNFNATSNNSNLILTSPSNAVLTIQDTDNYGTPNFLVANFNILQNAGQAVVTVTRTNGITGTISVNFTTFTPTNVTSPFAPAVAGTNYGATNGVLTFNSGVTAQSFIVPIYYTPTEASAANRIVGLELFNGTPAISNEFATITILDPELVVNSPGAVDLTTQNGTGFNGVVDSIALQPDGSILAGGNFTYFNSYPFNYVTRLLSSGDFDIGFLFDQAGPNGGVLQVMSQPPSTGETNGPILIAGAFSQVNNVARSGVARLNLDGSLDETFNPGAGADNTVFAMAETLLPTAVSNQSSIAYYLGGAFGNYNGAPNNSIVRVNASTNSPGYPGAADPNFNVGLGVTSSNGAVYALAVQANFQVVAGGDFTAFDSVTHDHLVRLNVDGSIDSTFDPDTGTNLTGSVRAIAVQPDGRIVIGGLFTNVNGSNYNYLARLNMDGSLDTNFNVGIGGNNSVLALAIDSQNRILVGGEFTTFSGTTQEALARSGITRLNPDGTVDPTINFGSAAGGGFIDSIVIQTNDEIDLAGGFSSFEGLPENNFVRVYGGAVFNGGEIQFTMTNYGVLENGTNALILLQRLGGEGTTNIPNVSVTFSTADGTAVAGTDYVAVVTNVVFPYGQTFETVTIPILNSNIVSSNKFLYLNLSNPTNTGIGAIALATLTITNVNSAVSFSASSYRQSANVPGSNAVITVNRIGDLTSTVGVTVYTGTNGTATPNVDYTPTTNSLVFNPYVTSLNFLVPLLNPPTMLNDETVDLEMSNPSNTFLGSPSSATLTIASVFTGPGQISFSQPSYTVSEGATNAVITLIRTNGSSSNIWVTLTTSNGTAISGINYQAVQTVVNFGPGETTETVDIPVFQLGAAGNNTTVYLILSNPGGGATISGPTQEVLTIQNDIENFSITNGPYFVSEGAGSVTIDIARSGPVSNTASISYTTFSPPNATEANGFAVPNVDYIPASGTLTFVPNETFSPLPPITILQGNTVNGPLTFQVILNNPSPAGVQIGTPGSTSVTILSDVTGFEFSTNAYGVAENGSNIVITVTRLNANTGAASVQFSTSDGTAVNGVDYIATNGTLTYLNGQSSNTFTVTILNQNIVEGNKSFNVTLFNPLVLTLPNPSTNAYLVAPSNAVVTITNVLTGIAFGSANFSVSECGVTATIPVILTGLTNNTVTVNYATANGGSAAAGTNYFPTNGTLVFAPGQTQQTFEVEVLNNHVIGPNHTVVLDLSNPQGAQLLNPSTAILTIDECNGAFIISSGTAFVSGNTPNGGGVIFPNETVTILFGLRDIAGGNTTNLVATLLATNGVTNVSGPQNYGALIDGGPTVSRPFTFEALGTNGQNIVANFTLVDGSQVYSNVAFGFTLAGSVSAFHTNETLYLVGSNNPPTDVSRAFNTNPPYFGYPSIINVSGILGNVTGVSATISNFGHTYPEDVALVLKSPTGADTVLMNGCGLDFGVNGLNLTFSQNASSPLPQSSALTSGTYLPTSYATVILPETNGAPVPPYPVTMTNFYGQSPNGAWALYAADENQQDSGYISNGWSLTFITGLPVEDDSDLELAMTLSPSAATLNNPLTYTISVTNYGPSIATNVIITDTLPGGATYVSNSCNCTAGTNGVLTFSAGTLAVSNGVTFSFEVIPTALGNLTNIAAAIANEPDPNSNNIQTNITQVSQPIANLTVDITASPNPVLDGGSVTYVITVTNNGPSQATGTMATNVLPVGFLPISITPSTGTTTNVNGTIYWNIGTLGSVTNSSATMTIVAGVNLPENILPTSTNLDMVTVGSLIAETTKTGNFAAVKTEVQPAMITVSASGKIYTLSWPATPGNIVLQGSVKLPPTWVNITNSSIVSQVVGGQTNMTYTLPGTNGYHFFRLMSHLP